MSETITIPDLSCPKLIDLALRDVQTHLTSCLGWLDYAFGKSEKQINAEGKTYPAIYVGNEEYLNMLPDSAIGNYSFFEIEDGGEIEQGKPDTLTSNKYTADFGLTFFFDFREVYPDEHDTKTVQNVISDVLTALSTARLNSVSIEVKRCFERAENIYRGYDRAIGSYGDYTSGEQARQFKKRPFGGFKLTGEIVYYQGC